VNFWQQQLRREPTILELPAPRVTSRSSHGAIAATRCERATLHQEVKSMLFADIVGYSKLTESVIPEFVGAFLERVSQLMAESKHPPRSVNMWGDAIYAVFDFASDAGSFALELTQMIQEGKDEWLRHGLYWEESGAGPESSKKHPLNIRVGLHAGPVFVHYNPVVRQLGYTGGHVNRAARIEPIAGHGEVFASEEFAALAELGREIQRHTGATMVDRESFVCDYAGSMQLAKSYPGRHRIYRVVPQRELAIEELAQGIHEFYCAKEKARGATRETNTSLRPWAELPEDLKNANRAQAADIPNKLLALGFELAPSFGSKASEMAITDAQVEALAIREHDRWMDDRRRHGWARSSNKTKDEARKQHPSLIPWEQLSEPEKEKDRDTVRNLPDYIEMAGFRVRKIAGETLPNRHLAGG
jgi:class 3 adenylate cyclase